jgi:hypothetical protein
MPFTLSHPAAVVPLARPLGRLAVPSALVIGSMAPDLGYFLPLDITRRESHSLAGLAWFCLPAGLAAYLVFQWVLRAPLTGLLPAALADRLPPPGPRSRLRWLAVVVSLLAGASTHLAWDAFTHGGTAATRLMPWLASELVTIRGHRLLVYKGLQYASTVGGAVALAWWLARWMGRTPRRAQARPGVLPARSRAAMVGAVAIAATGWALLSAAPALAGRISGATLHLFAARAAIEGLTALALLLIGYSLAWHVAMLGGPGRVWEDGEQGG